MHNAKNIYKCNNDNKNPLWCRNQVQKSDTACRWFRMSTNFCLRFSRFGFYTGVGVFNRYIVSRLFPSCRVKLHDGMSKSGCGENHNRKRMTRNRERRTEVGSNTDIFIVQTRQKCVLFVVVNSKTEVQMFSRITLRHKMAKKKINIKKLFISVKK